MFLNDLASMAENTRHEYTQQLPHHDTIDIEAVLDSAVALQNRKLLWRTSVVDLLKTLHINSSGLEVRKMLASKLKYSGDMGN